jgi:hypothetical protein
MAEIKTFKDFMNNGTEEIHEMKVIAKKSRADKKKISVDEMCGAIHEMAMTFEESDDKSETYENYIKECGEKLKEMKKEKLNEKNK